MATAYETFSIDWQASTKEDFDNDTGVLFDQMTALNNKLATTDSIHNWSFSGEILSITFSSGSGTDRFMGFYGGALAMATSSMPDASPMAFMGWCKTPTPMAEATAPVCAP